MHILSCGADDRILFSVHRYARAVLISVYARFGVSWKVVTVFIADADVTAVHLAPGRAVIAGRDYLVILSAYLWKVLCKNPIRRFKRDWISAAHFSLFTSTLHTKRAAI